MPTLKREIFMRPNRMTHRFGQRDDPLMPGSEQTFEWNPPIAPKATNSNQNGRLNIKTHGLHVYTEPFSPIDKARGGKASFSGPKLDEPDAVAENMPASTQMRRTQGPLIVSKKKGK